MRIASLLLVCVACALGACGGTPRIVPGPVYPASAARTGTVDIQVIRRGSKIQLTNTTARAFGPATLWLNERYARPIDGLAVGQELTLPLGEFLDEFSQKFRAGGFFATQNPERLALAELETEGKVVGLIVVGADSR